MKKLMFAAIACAAVTGFAVESKNIVGYAGNGLRAGATMVTAQFVGLNNVSNRLESFVPTGNGVLDVVEIKVLDRSGSGVVGQDYFWTNGKYLDNPIEELCWTYDYSGKAEGVMFGPAQGLWVYGQDGQGIQAAGQVEQVNDAIVKLRAGATGCGNPFPVAIALQDILPEGNGVLDVVEIKILDRSGSGVAGEDYFWTNGKYLDNPIDELCWTFDYSGKVEGKYFDPGQGLWVYGQDGQTLRFPVPESIQAK